MTPEIQSIIERMIPLFDELSEICKTWTFELPNGRFTVDFDEKASEQ